MKSIYKWGAVAFGVSLVSTIVYGQARTPFTRPAYVTTPGSVTTSAGGDQFVCSSTTAVCEVESNISAATMTSTVPAFDIGPTATPGANDRLACFSYGPSGSKTRMMCVDESGDLNATSLRAGVAKYPNQIRLHALTQTTNYAPSIFGANHAVFGRDGDTGANSGGVWLSYHTTDNEGVIGSLSPGTSWRPLSVAASSFKFRPVGGSATVTLGTGVTTTGAIEGSGYNSTIASGSQAFTCTNVGCRLSLGNTGRYLFDNGTNLASNSIFSASQFVSRYYTASTTPVEVGTTVSTAEANPIQFSTSNTFTGETVNFVSAFNGPNQIFAFSKDGLLRVNKHNAAKPTCNADNRGRIFFLDGASGAADVFEVCGKDATNAYSWKSIVTW